jgi:uncharacterized protein (TIGR03118 family)
MHASFVRSARNANHLEGRRLMRIIIVLPAMLMFALGVQAQTTNYSFTNIVTDAQDSHLANPWGLAHAPKNNHLRNEWWASDEISGLSTLYNADGTILPLVITIPPASGDSTGSPTGSAGRSSDFAFATLDGTISVWNANAKPSKPGIRCYECHVSSATIMVNNAANGASYQGLTIATNAASGALTYYAANANAGIEAYDATSFAALALPQGAFSDPKIPKTYTPAGIQLVGARIFVTYNATAGGGTGFVDGFDTNGKLVLRLQSGWFNQPWAVVATPVNFGTFSNMILVGNTGSGWIGAYNRTTGAFEGLLQNDGVAVEIPGLWGLGFGDGTTQSGPTDVLYFNAGGA